MSQQSRQSGRLTDNVCAAVCRMIMAQQDRVPLAQVSGEEVCVCVCVCVCILRIGEGERYETCLFAFIQVIPVLLHNVPLKEDMEENGTVYGCIISLLNAGNQTVGTKRLFLLL